MSIAKPVDLLYNLYKEVALGPNSTSEEKFKEAVFKKGSEWVDKWYDSYKNNIKAENYWDMFYDFCAENNFEIDYEF